MSTFLEPLLSLFATKYNWVNPKKHLTSMHLICSKISGLSVSLHSILAFMATIIDCVLSSVPCLADFSAAPERTSIHAVWEEQTCDQVIVCL